MKTKLALMLIYMSISTVSFSQDRHDFWKKINWSKSTTSIQMNNSEDSPTDGRISLRLAGNGYYITILLGFIQEGTINYDDGYDGFFINDGSVLEFYSMSGNDRFSIQALPELIQTDVEVPLGYELTRNATYTISIDAEYLNPNFDILLEDRNEDIFTDLRQTSYSFDGIAGEFNNRFFLKLNLKSLGIEDIENDTAMHAYFTNDMLNIHVKQEKSFKTVELFNISGKHILSTKFTDQIEADNLAKGVYILRCTNNAGATIIKKIVK